MVPQFSEVSSRPLTGGTGRQIPTKVLHTPGVRSGQTRPTHIIAVTPKGKRGTFHYE